MPLYLKLFCILILTLPQHVFAEDADAEPTEAIVPENGLEADTAETTAQKPGISLSDIAGCVERDGAWYWSDGVNSYKASKRNNTSVTIETNIGEIRVKNTMFTDEPGANLKALAQLIERAQAAKLNSESSLFLYSDSNITGPRLTRSTDIVLSEAALTLQEIEKYDAKILRDKLEAASNTLIEQLDTYSKLDKIGKNSVRNVLGRLHWKDAEEEQYDAIPPSFARRVIRYGWLEQILGTNEQTKAVREAVKLADAYQVLRLYGEKKNTLKLVSNAFEDQAWVLQTEQRTVYSRTAPKPIYHFKADKFSENVQLIVELTGWHDPLNEQAPLSETTRLILEEKDSHSILAQWVNGEFTSDLQLWRAYLPIPKGKVADFIPPHITQISLFGDIIKIATPNGELNALTKTDSTHTELFLEKAKEVLTTPAYLDLIGEYMLTYVYDSPDSSTPHLIGTSDNSSDIHQTALQTLETSCGGQFRGDCDDLSELYHNILDRQGHIPHVVSLPSHAACAWAVNMDDKWHTYVLQTGPALEFVDSTLQGSLEKAYKSFDENDTFDPNGVSLLLRFSGENTRSSWRLSYRIFNEAEYAETMINVQRDWHFQTYQHAIQKMLEMIANGDEDTANFRELSGLYSFTGQYQKAAEYHQMAIDRTPEETSRLYMGMELVQHLFEAELNDKAFAAAQEIFDVQLPKLKKSLRGSEVTFALQMAGSLNHDGARDLALDFLHDYVSESIHDNLNKIVQWVNSDQFDLNAWKNARDLSQLRRVIKWYITTAVLIIEKRGYADLESNPQLKRIMDHIEIWNQSISAIENEEPDDILGTYSLIANSYLMSIPLKALISEIEKTPLPTTLKYNHRVRLSGIPQFKQDLPWIRLSVPFWWGQISHQFDQQNDVSNIDKELINVCQKYAEEAFAHAEAKGIAGAFIRKQIHYVRVVTALVNEDEASLRELLQYVKDKDDKRLRDDTAQWMGDCAKVLSLEWYGKMLDVWTEVLDYKPKYYWIAWRAALNKAPQHALLVAKRAAERFKDDPAFVEEYETMKALFTVKP